MADVIAVMNQGAVEQIGTPQEIYDRPRSMFVAEFIGAPAMNFLDCPGTAARAAIARIASTARRIAVPELREDRAEGEFVLGVRPEHMSLRRCLAGCAARCSAPSISAPRRS